MSKNSVEAFPAEATHLNPAAGISPCSPVGISHRCVKGRLQLSLLAYNLGNLWWLVLPKRIAHELEDMVCPGIVPNARRLGAIPWKLRLFPEST